VKTYDKATDYLHLARALELARSTIGFASPNPHVGAVVVDTAGEIAGEGAHYYDLHKHAEVVAIEQAGERARGGTLYLNLEPCCHHGRTGPCVEAVIAAGIRRVVASMVDPNPRVAGGGFARLRAAGIEVEVGTDERKARKLNEGFAKWIRTGKPLVTLKSAMTLDGKIAPSATESRNPSALGAKTVERGWITGEAARAHVQQLRHAADAILVGVGTVIADDPWLTDRTGHGRRRPLMRVILDSSLRIPLDSRIVQSASEDVVVFCTTAGAAERRQELEKRGVRVECVPARDGRPDLAAAIDALGAMQITSLIIEGGAAVNSAALEAGLVDKVFLYYAPKILAGAGAVSFANGSHSRAMMGEAAIVREIELHQFAEDFAVEGYLRNPYAL